MKEKIQELERQIAALPIGYISKKTINGKTRYRLIQMASVWKNRTRKFHSVPKVTQTFVFFICWPNRRRC